MNATSIKPLRKALFYVFLIIIGAMFIVPLFWLILCSLKTQQEMVTLPPIFLPNIAKFTNYFLALTKINYFGYLWNTIALSMIYTIPGIITASIFGYAFARFRVPGKNFFFSIVIVLLMIPPVSVMLPEYVFYTKLRIINTYYIWLLWGLGANPLYI